MFHGGDRPAVYLKQDVLVADAGGKGGAIGLHAGERVPERPPREVATEASVQTLFLDNDI
jgi:hypothetical protein